MSDLSPTQLLTRILLDFCIPSIRGTGIGQEVGKPIELNEQQRRDAGLTKAGMTYAYAAKDAAVFLDLNADRAQIWFIHPEAHAAKDVVGRALTTAFPSVKQSADIATADAKRRERVLVGDLGESKGVQVDVSYPTTTQGANNLFVVRVQGLRITDHALFERSVKAGGQQPSKRGAEPEPKKKGWF